MKNKYRKFVDLLTISNSKLLVSFFFLFFIFTIIAILPKAFAQVQPVKSIEIFSEKLDYLQNEPGAWKITKSANWTGKGEALITFDLNTIVKPESEYTDVLLLIDVSKSMTEERLEKIKSEVLELANDILSNENNRVALITLTSNSQIVSEFTNDMQTLTKKINSLSLINNRNYYRALININEILKNYKVENNRNCKALILTTGCQNEENSNSEFQYNYLKKNFPFLVIDTVQYSGNTIFECNKNIGDRQYLANNNNLNEVLHLATENAKVYDAFSITDYINDDYFYVEKKSDISTDNGEALLDSESQKVVWDLTNLKSGSKAELKIKIKLREKYINSGGMYLTNSLVETASSISSLEENVTSSKTPIITDKYRVKYEANVPDKCTINDFQTEGSAFVFETVNIGSISPKCEGYQFKGWDILTDSVQKLNDDYIIMPEEDIIVRAKWSKMNVYKSIDGEMSSYLPPVLQRVGVLGYDEKLWAYKDLITKITFSNEIIGVDNAKYFWDISEVNNGSVMAYLVPNSSNTSTYTAYIQGDGNIIANQDSSYLFEGFKNLQEIIGLEFIDTTNATDMSYMFYNCLALTSIDLHSFNTSNVTDMSHMFQAYDENIELVMSLKSLDLSMFDTSKVTTMRSMFNNCRNLSSLRLTNFNTSKVTDMSYMFRDCRSLNYIVLRVFDTSNVTDMSYMFFNCIKAASIDLSSFNTSKVVDMGHMFQAYDEGDTLSMSVTSLDFSSFDTSNVTSMHSMFYNCRNLESIFFDNFNTANVTDMAWMFYNCLRLPSLNLSHFNTEKVMDMSHMFQAYSEDDSLFMGFTSLNLSSFNTSNVTNMRSMFNNCGNLETLNLGNFDTAKVTDMSWMFYNCLKLKSLDLSSFDTKNVTDMSHMFQGFAGLMSLTSLNLSSFDTRKVTNMQSIFYNCSNLKSLDLTKFNTAKVINMSSMFYGCSNLSTTITISNASATYSNMFIRTATSTGAKIMVNYINTTSALVDKMISTKSSTSNVVKGSLVSV